MDLKVKIKTGYNEYQTIRAEEAHKAYYLFLNKEAKTIFSNGVALRGQDVMAVLPDYNATMGWNETHKLDDDDMNDLKRHGVIKAIDEVLYKSNLLAKKKIGLQLDFSEAVKMLPKPTFVDEGVKKLSDKFKMG